MDGKRIAAIVILVGTLAWFLRACPSTEPGPRDVNANIDPTLTALGAWHVGYNEGEDAAKGESTEVILKRTSEHRLHMTVHEHRADLITRPSDPEGFAYQSIAELWIDFDDDGDPSARADLRAGPTTAKVLTSFLGITGSVTLSRSLVQSSSAAEHASALIVQYTLTGDYGGSPGTDSGKILVE